MSTPTNGRSALFLLLYPTLKNDYVWMPTKLFSAFTRDRAGYLGMYLVIARLWQQHHKDYPDGIPLSDKDLQTFCSIKERGAFLNIRNALLAGGWIVMTTVHYKTWYTPAWGKRRNGTIPVWKSSKEKYGRIIGKTKIDTQRIPCSLVDVYMGKLIPNISRAADIRRYTHEPRTVKTLSNYLMAIRGATLRPEERGDLQQVGLMNDQAEPQSIDHHTALIALDRAGKLNDDGIARMITLGLKQPPDQQKNARSAPLFLWQISLIMILYRSMISLFHQQALGFSPSQSVKSASKPKRRDRRSMRSTRPIGDDLLLGNHAETQPVEEDQSFHKNKQTDQEVSPFQQSQPDRDSADSEKNHRLEQRLQALGIYPKIRQMILASNNVGDAEIDAVLAEAEKNGKGTGWIATVLRHVALDGIEHVRGTWTVSPPRANVPDHVNLEKYRDQFPPASLDSDSASEITHAMVTDQSEAGGDHRQPDPWHATLASLQQQVIRYDYDVWLKSTMLVNLSDNLAVVGAPTIQAKQVLEDRFMSQMRRTLSDVLGYPINIRVIIAVPRGKPSQPPAGLAEPPKRDTHALDSASVWHATLASLQQQVIRYDYDVWLKPTMLVNLSDNLAVVGAPTIQAKQVLEDRFMSQMRRALSDVLGYPINIRVIIGCSKTN